ncbi:RNA-binding S4 domain-containing protein [Roseovarius tibetensis]|uniref:RNA-binding S4 domain-containing protein n=1 Tax=Roseovarius tibetensis TaxID=2685897 RepID=UPI003D7FD149
MQPEPRPSLRLDKWLWHARFFKTRTLAARQVSAGHVRVNGKRVSKPAHMVGPQDVLTFAQGDAVKVVRVVEIGSRRGPAPEAQALYDDLSEPAPRDSVASAPPAPKYEGKGRPTKRDRRKMDLKDRWSLE